ncbi:DUF4373 domain-containing protein [Pediococcus pentosaceus]|uniref:DUF4373 domain-containing protein n=1 Tax=Pediococcus pentosaceus TaxID=1255 RepID=UPI001909A208|nr:DUF4373 domain-containing protein [Pediococcus pentosaceus]MBF7125493.1 DUF4373 domain-containing protein [Pediococcus pentosaceus]WPK17450.1 DUF4373 domain-containing protein [Pediococcus pentosaceus]
MARPTKVGLDYFPFDVDFNVNEKTEAIMGEFGAKGVLPTIFIFSAIYKRGYFLEWTPLVKNSLANRIDGVNSKLVEQVVNRLVAYGTFDEELFNSAKVLTSLRIQTTYLEATKRRKAPRPTLYWLVDEIENEINVDINPQSKGNKNKLNQSNKDLNLIKSGCVNDPIPMVKLT